MLPIDRARIRGVVSVYPIPSSTNFMESDRYRNSGIDPAAISVGTVELASMKQEALKELDHDAFAALVRKALEDEPEGLRSVELYAALGAYGSAPPMKYLQVWLAELSRADDIVHDFQNKRYLHPEYSAGDTEAH